MTPEQVGADPAAVEVRLNKEQVSAIWPGLNYIICQWLTKKEAGQSITSYPFQSRPLPPGSDSGTFSARMMDRVQQLWIKSQPIRATGGTIWLDEFELRAAILSARTSVKHERYEIQREAKKRTAAQSRVANAKRALKRKLPGKERVVEFLETALKQANRRLKSVVGPEEFKSQSAEWQSHLRWIEWHLTYFKSVPVLSKSIRKMQKDWVDILVDKAEKAIVNLKYKLPEPAALRRVMSLFLTYSLRGRMGTYNHIFMVQNQNTPAGEFELFDFVNKRIPLKKAS